MPWLLLLPGKEGDWVGLKAGLAVQEKSGTPFHCWVSNLDFLTHGLVPILTAILVLVFKNYKI
jgi:hypothetical protein